jgi:hypothetical protein
MLYKKKVSGVQKGEQLTLWVSIPQKTPYPHSAHTLLIQARLICHHQLELSFLIFNLIFALCKIYYLGVLHSFTPPNR